MPFVENMGRSFDHDYPGFVDNFVVKERALQDEVGKKLYQDNLWDYRYMILNGFWSRYEGRIVQPIVPLWTEDIGQYYHDLGYPFHDPDKRFLKTMYWHIVREYMIYKSLPNKSGGKCQHPDCSCPTSTQLNVHHGSISKEQYAYFNDRPHWTGEIISIVGREHLHQDLLTVLCRICHTKVTEFSRANDMARPRIISSKDKPEQFKQMMNLLGSDQVVNKHDVEPSTIITIGDMIKYQQGKEDKSSTNK